MKQLIKFYFHRFNFSINRSKDSFDTPNFSDLTFPGNQIFNRLPCQKNTTNQISYPFFLVINQLGPRRRLEKIPVEAQPVPKLQNFLLQLRPELVGRFLL